MTIRHLTIFLAVAEYGTMSAAPINAHPLPVILLNIIIFPP